MEVDALFTETNMKDRGVYSPNQIHFLYPNPLFWVERYFCALSSWFVA
jgi:hypothetical protein